VPITVKELRKWLKFNSILDRSDMIDSITVDETKQVVRVTGRGEEKGTMKDINFTATFDELKPAVKFSKKAERNRLYVIEDDIPKDEVKDEVRDAEQKGPEEERSSGESKSND